MSDAVSKQSTFFDELPPELVESILVDLSPKDHFEFGSSLAHCNGFNYSRSSCRQWNCRQCNNPLFKQSEIDGVLDDGARLVLKSCKGARVLWMGKLQERWNIGAVACHGCEITIGMCCVRIDILKQRSKVKTFIIDGEWIAGISSRGVLGSNNEGKVRCDQCTQVIASWSLLRSRSSQYKNLSIWEEESFLFEDVLGNVRRNGGVHCVGCNHMLGELEQQDGKVVIAVRELAISKSLRLRQRVVEAACTPSMIRVSKGQAHMSCAC